MAPSRTPTKHIYTKPFQFFMCPCSISTKYFLRTKHFEYAAFEDPSLMSKLLFAFATGKMQLEAEQLELYQGYQSQFMAVAVTKDMLQNIALSRPAPFQLMLSAQLEHYNVKAELLAYLSSIRLSASTSHLGNLAVAGQETSAGVRVATDILDMASAHFDNVGFKGRKKLWSQHCVIQVKTISKTQLKNDGFYQGTLDRKQLTFSQLAETVELDMYDVEDDPEGAAEFEEMDNLVAKVVDVREDDKALLNRQVLKSIDCAINLNLPTADEC